MPTIVNLLQVKSLVLNSLTELFELSSDALWRIAVLCRKLCNPTIFFFQVWYSKDGGNSFKLLLKLKDDNVIKAIACPRTNAVIFITDNNVIYYTRPGKFGFRFLC